MRQVGSRRVRVDGPRKLVGRAGFTSDSMLADLAHARLVLSPYPAARIVSVDLDRARRAPGVLAAVSASDLPAIPAGGASAPLARGRVAYVGQPVAAVVALSEAQAADAAQMVEVEYQILPHVANVDQALAPGAPPVLVDGAQASDEAAAHGFASLGAEAGTNAQSPNVTSAMRLARGDVAAGFASSQVVVEGTYHVPAVHQAFLEPHVVRVRAEADGAYTVYSPTQGIFPTRAEMASQLGIPGYQVRVLQTEVGGGFGGKQLLLEPLAALLSRRVGRPVELALTRQEEFLIGRGAPDYKIALRLGAGRDGTLLALSASVDIDEGSGGGGFMGTAPVNLAGTYKVPNFEVVTREVATNKTPVGAYRAPGAPQGFFALESAMDELARRLDLDPIELRLKNAVQEGDLRPDGRPWPAIGMRECLEVAARHPAYTAPRADGEGIGVALGCWLGGLEPAAALCRVDPDGSVVLMTGHSDISGTDTTLAMIAAEVLGVDPSRVRVRGGDTETAPHAGMAGGSKTVYTVGAAVQEAAQAARQQLLEIAAEELEADVGDLEVEDGRVRVKGVPSRAVEVGTLSSLAARFGGRYRPVLGEGRSAQLSQSPMFTVQIARVAADCETGALEIREVAAIQDVGRALNPAEIEGQVHGGTLQGLGRALGEELYWDESGALRSLSFLDYLIPSIDQTPRSFSVSLVEVESPFGPFGAKGVGEPPAVPGPAAVANAVFDATGRRLRSLPLGGETLWRASAD